MTSHLKKKFTTKMKLYATNEFISNDILFKKKNKKTISPQK